MLEFTIPAIVLFVGYLIFFLITFQKKRLIVHLFQASFVVYISFVIKFTLFPFPFTKQTIQVMRTAELHRNSPYELSNNFIPFEFLASGNLLTLGVIGNIALLAFLGIYIPLTSKRLHSMKAVFLITFFVSLSIELTQLTVSKVVGFTYRIFNIDDIILNVVGACIVYALLLGATHLYKQATEVNLFDEFYALKV